MGTGVSVWSGCGVPPCALGRTWGVDARVYSRVGLVRCPGNQVLLRSYSLADCGVCWVSGGAVWYYSDCCRPPDRLSGVLARGLLCLCCVVCVLLLVLRFSHRLPVLSVSAVLAYSGRPTAQWRLVFLSFWFPAGLVVRGRGPQCWPVRIRGCVSRGGRYLRGVFVLLVVCGVGVYVCLV